MRGGFLTTKLTRKTIVHQNVYTNTHILMYNKWEGEFKTQVLKKNEGIEKQLFFCFGFLVFKNKENTDFFKRTNAY